VRLFYNLMPQRHRWAERQKEPAEFVVDETFTVPGVGTVVAGTLKKGVLSPNMTMLMGPDMEAGAFKPVAIKSIHYKRLPVTHVVAGQTAALAIKKIKKNQVGASPRNQVGASPRNQVGASPRPCVLPQA